VLVVFVDMEQAKVGIFKEVLATQKSIAVQLPRGKQLLITPRQIISVWYFGVIGRDTHPHALCAGATFRRYRLIS
jgi:hypothetical protein